MCEHVFFCIYIWVLCFFFGIFLLFVCFLLIWFCFVFVYFIFICLFYYFLGACLLFNEQKKGFGWEEDWEELGEKKS